MTDVFEGYKRLTLNGNLALMRVSSMGALRLTDEVILDCDGVLIDSGDSYDRAIEMTVAYFLSSVFNLKLNPVFPTKKLQIKDAEEQANTTMTSTQLPRS